MGPIVDRTKETLVSTDSGIIMARQRLLRAVKAFVEGGVIPLASIRCTSGTLVAVPAPISPSRTEPVKSSLRGPG